MVRQSIDSNLSLCIRYAFECMKWLVVLMTFELKWFFVFISSDVKWILVFIWSHVVMTLNFKAGQKAQLTPAEVVKNVSVEHFCHVILEDLKTHGPCSTCLMTTRWCFCYANESLRWHHKRDEWPISDWAEGKDCHHILRLCFTGRLVIVQFSARRRASRHFTRPSGRSNERLSSPGQTRIVVCWHSYTATPLHHSLSLLLKNEWKRAHLHHFLSFYRRDVRRKIGLQLLGLL